MKSASRSVVALVSTDDTPKGLRPALEQAGFEVPQTYAGDLRGAQTALSTFVETYKPDVIVLDSHGPADEAVKDILSLKSLRSARGTPVVFACSCAKTYPSLPENVGVLRLTDGTVGAVLSAVKDALANRAAA